MIIVKLKGGLGNQLFQYACGKAISLKSGHKLIFDKHYLLRQFKTITKREFKLMGLAMAPDKISEFKKNKPIMHVSDKNIKNISTSPLTAGTICLNGYFQSPDYFNEWEIYIRDEINQFIGKKGENMLSAHKIDEVPISIHMRRSDYLMPAQLRFHGLCAASYYQEAVGLTVEKVEKPFFYIFSDSPDEAEKVFPSLMQRYKIVSNMENNEPETDILELGAMRDCKHQIIANSSFSWWGAWLSETFPGKIVIAPRKWYVTSTLSQSPADAMKHWKKI